MLTVVPINLGVAVHMCDRIKILYDADKMVTNVIESSAQFCCMITNVHSIRSPEYASWCCRTNILIGRHTVVSATGVLTRNMANICVVQQ